jgi:hypothetical protein
MRKRRGALSASLVKSNEAASEVARKTLFGACSECPGRLTIGLRRIFDPLALLAGFDLSA